MASLSPATAPAAPAALNVANSLSGLPGSRPSSVPASKDPVFKLDQPALLDHPDSPQLEESSDELLAPLLLGEGGTLEIRGMVEDAGGDRGTASAD